MSEIREQLAYSSEHEWAVRVEGARVRIGITDYAQHQLGDVVFVEFPEIGAEVEEGQAMGTVESVKTVSDLYSPVSGKVVACNEDLVGRPELINEAPYDGGWIVEVEVAGDANAALAQLLTAEKYRELVE
ncbi:glycine cleavage system protein GcvH [Paenibacillus cymbidii]|uniref:glycine cleavage system protein GcvH n=1 Tax=Paenibacillus cymbidii TaxID=1639034 RepID=UPI00108219F1|nr:glycine cleavage system protein GcvH [Paenibacillus cymbidii]